MKVHPYRDGNRMMSRTMPYYADSAKRLKRSRKALFIIIISALVTASLLPAAAQRLNQNMYEKSSAQVDSDASVLSEDTLDTDTFESTSSASQENISGSEVEVSTEGNTSVSSSTSVKVQVTNDTHHSGMDSAEENSSVTINGEHIDIPENGRINERIRDRDSDTRIRARVDSDSSGSSSINISTNETVESDND